MRVIELAALPTSSISEIAELISHDPALAIKVLKVANSPLYGLRRKAENLRQALNILGLDAAITLALSFSLTGALRDSTATAGFDTEYFWRRSVIAGVAARTLGAQLRIKDGEELMLAGLLQDIGMLALSALLQEEYGLILADETDHDAAAEAERLALGADHAEVGAWLLEQWHLPAYLHHIVANSHGHHNASSSSDRTAITNCVVLSGLIADTLLQPDNTALATRTLKQAQDSLGMADDDYRTTLDSISMSLPEVSEIFEINLIDPLQAEAIRDQANEIMMIRHMRMHEEVNQVRRTAEELSAHSQKLEDQVHRDSLTGLYNRSHFDEILLMEFAHATEQDWPLSIAFIDLDDFKHINDTFGHAVGDEVLQAIAGVMHSHTRQSDLLARYGGEEFVAILPGTGSGGACTLFERIMAAVRGIDYAALTGRSLHATLSIGVAAHMDQGREFSSAVELLQAADYAMYAAKHAGRNRLVVYNDEPLEAARPEHGQ